MAGVDESGKPTSISHSADNLRVEREQYASWDRDEYAQNYLRNLGLDTAGMLRSMERTDTGLNYRHSFDSAIAMNLNPVYGQPEPMRNRGFMGRQLDSFSQWRDGVFNTYQDIAIQSGGGFMTGLVAAVETPTRLGLGVAEGALGLGGLLFDSSVRQDAANGMPYLFNNYDTVVPGAFNRWMDQSWDRQLSDLFVLGGEGLLGGVTGKYTWQAGKYGGSLIYNGVDRFGNGLSDAIFSTLSNSPTELFIRQIDSGLQASSNRMLHSDLQNATHVYRAVRESDLDFYQFGISGRGGNPTYFSLDAGNDVLSHMQFTQMKPDYVPDTLLKIPVSEIKNAVVPRPLGYEHPALRPSVGFEYYTSSYNQFGSGGFRQFMGTTSTFDPNWIVKGWGKQ